MKKYSPAGELILADFFPQKELFTQFGYRKNMKLKQYELAEMAGFSEKHLCRIENGKYLPKLEHFLSLVSILNLSLADFGMIENESRMSQTKTKLINKIVQTDENKLKIYEEMFDYTEKIIEKSLNK